MPYSRVDVPSGLGSKMLKFLLLVQLVYLSASLELQPRFQWKQLEIELDTADPAKNIILPSGLDVYDDTLFITIPRTDTYQVSLATANLSDSNSSPKLKAYPNYGTYEEGKEIISKIGSALRVHVDHCKRLWVLDNGGIKKTQGQPDVQYPPALIVYNLTTQTIIEKYNFDSKVKFNDAKFAVEDKPCDKTYVYVNDAATNEILVYSLEKKESWHTSIKGVSVLALVPNKDGNFNTLYFKNSDGLLHISTEILQVKTNTDHTLTKLQHWNVNFDASIVDPITGDLYYSIENKINVVPCWTKDTKSVANAVVDSTLKVTDFKVVSNGKTSTVYVLVTSNDNKADVKIKLLTGSHTVNRTACDATNTNANNNRVENTPNANTTNIRDNTANPNTNNKGNKTMAGNANGNNDLENAATEKANAKDNLVKSTTATANTNDKSVVADADTASKNSNKTPKSDNSSNSITAEAAHSSSTKRIYYSVVLNAGLALLVFCNY